jgi:glycosyltransferase involved in cell wall biosynthesis
MNVYKKSQISALNEDLSFGSEQIPEKVNTRLQTQLAQRLAGNIEYLNMCDLIIGVSSDVKNILTKYGVKSDLILVNHIGSEIAQRKIVHSKKIDQNNIVFGFIGGVGYYKGVHQLVEAYMLLSPSLKSKSSIYIYGKYDIGYFNSLMQVIETDEIAKDRILFKGKFSPSDLPAITNTIDISVLPSLCADTAPQTIFESFSAGLPIIAPSVGGFPDFVEHNINGLLYEKASVSDLNKQLEKVILESELIKKFSLNIPPLKTMSEHVSQLEEIYATS